MGCNEGGGERLQHINKNVTIVLLLFLVVIISFNYIQYVKQQNQYHEVVISDFTYDIGTSLNTLKKVKKGTDVTPIQDLQKSFIKLDSLLKYTGNVLYLDYFHQYSLGLEKILTHGQITDRTYRELAYLTNDLEQLFEHLYQKDVSKKEFNIALEKTIYQGWRQLFVERQIFEVE